MQVKKFLKPKNGGSSTVIRNYGFANTTSSSSVSNIDCVSVNADTINTNYIEANSGKFIYLIGEDGQIEKIEGNQLNYESGKIDDLKSNTISTQTLNVDDTATIQNIINTNLASTNIVTDYLTVNKSAHFFELIIDKIRSVQGTQINTAANCIVDFVEAYDSNNDLTDPEGNSVAYYRVYWRNTDSDGRSVSNDWLALDQALCESFNVQTGTTYDVSNKYYWRKVIATDNGTPKYVNFDTKEVKTTAPSDFTITFSNMFNYVINEGTVDEDSFNNFDIQSQIAGEWDGVDTWTVESLKYGLQIVPVGIKLYGGKLKFTTSEKTKLTIGIYYDDNTFDYLPASDYQTSYSIESSATDKAIEAYVILSEVIEKWDACNWIDLSNSDMDATVSGKSAIPSIGDNICQLGYRYTELTNPTQDDINRASAIIIAAYNTPDSGIVPPSYAQYQNITDYSLGSHRKSYFDATGCYIVGNFAVQASGGNIPLDQYIQSFNSANPCDISVITDYANKVDLIILQTNNSSAITNINNFPTNLQVTPTISGAGAFPGAYTYNSFTLSMFGIIYDLLTFDNTDPTQYLPAGYEGIYLKRVDYSSLRYYKLEFDFTGTTQTITTSSVVISIDLTHISSGNYYSYTKSIPVNGVSSVEGTDAELWQLYKDTEYAEVQRNKSLNVQLRYAIQHIVGTTSTIVAPTNQKLKITRYKLDGTALNTTILTSSDYISSGGKTGNGYWEYTYTLANWYTEQNKPIYFLVELLDNNDGVLSNTIVDITLESSSLFTVEDGLTQSIQANTTAINDEVQTRQTQYSAISQTVNNINSTVSNHTTSINNMSSEISQIDQRADNIELSVTNIETDLDTLETNIERTGIDIEQGKITLTAENTVIDGNLSIHNANEGLVIYDNSTGTPKIAVQGNQIGTYTDFISNGNVVSDQYDARTTINGNRVTFQTISIGDLSADNKLSVHASMTDMTSTTVTAISYTYNLLKNGNVESTTSGSASRTGSWYDFYIPEFTVSNAGSYSVQVILTVTGANPNDEFMILLGVTRTLSVLQKIGTDGAFFGTSWQRLSWFGSDRQRLQYDNNYIELNNNGVMYHPTGALLATEIGSTTTVVRRTSGTSYSAGANEGLIVIANGVSEYAGWYTIYLPFPTMLPGKVYYIKNYSHCDVRVGVGNSADERYMLDDDGTGLENFRNIGHDSYMIISDGVYWIMWFCA